MLLNCQALVSREDSNHCKKRRCINGALCLSNPLKAVAGFQFT